MSLAAFQRCVDYRQNSPYKYELYLLPVLNPKSYDGYKYEWGEARGD